MKETEGSESIDARGDLQREAAAAERAGKDRGEDPGVREEARAADVRRKARTMNAAPLGNRTVIDRIGARFSLGLEKHAGELWYRIENAAGPKADEDRARWILDRFRHAEAHLDAWKRGDGSDDHLAAAGWFILTAMHLEAWYGAGLQERMRTGEELEDREARKTETAGTTDGDHREGRAPPAAETQGSRSAQDEPQAAEIAAKREEVGDLTGTGTREGTSRTKMGTPAGRKAGNRQSGDMRERCTGV